MCYCSTVGMGMSKHKPIGLLLLCAIFTLISEANAAEGSKNRRKKDCSGSFFHSSHPSDPDKLTV